MALARRFTLSRPGSSPSKASPLSMQPSITDQIWLSPSFTSHAGRIPSSLERFMAAIDKPLSLAMRSIVAARSNG